MHTRIRVLSPMWPHSTPSAPLVPSGTRRRRRRHHCHPLRRLCPSCHRPCSRCPPRRRRLHHHRRHRRHKTRRAPLARCVQARATAVSLGIAAGAVFAARASATVPPVTLTPTARCASTAASGTRQLRSGPPMAWRRPSQAMAVWNVWPGTLPNLAGCSSRCLRSTHLTSRPPHQRPQPAGLLPTPPMPPVACRLSPSQELRAVAA